MSSRESNQVAPQIRPRDTSTWDKTPQQVERRARAEEKGLQVFNESDANTGDYVCASRYFAGERGECEGVLRVRRESGTGRPLEIFVGNERIRFRNLYSLDVAV